VSDEKARTEKKPRGGAIGRAWRMEGISSGRTRLFVRLGVVALLLAIFVFVPMYIALQPSFVERYPNLAARHTTWTTSVHASVPCQRCHVSPKPLAQAAYAVRMLGEFYVSFVARDRQPDLYPVPTNAACESCHSDLRTVSPKGDLNIPHRAHVNVLKMECVRCHKYLVHVESPEGKHTPTMAGCLTCHNGKLAKNSCSTCHTAKAIPESHKAADWTAVHAQMQGKVDCKPCHAWTKNWCADCHSRRPRDHAADWRTKHGEQVKTHRNCEACHQAAFCVRCHGEVPQLNFNPALQPVK
jgi:hypothetical protein